MLPFSVSCRCDFILWQPPHAACMLPKKKKKEKQNRRESRQQVQMRNWLFLRGSFVGAAPCGVNAVIASLSLCSTVAIFECEKTFERIFLGALFGPHAPHFIAGWRSDFQDQVSHIYAAYIVYTISFSPDSMKMCAPWYIFWSMQHAGN